MSTGHGAQAEAVCKTNKDAFEASTDFSNYFCTYGFLFHQKQMLEDTRRMDGYFNGIMKNKACFKDKVVLDVGTGTGILAMWAAKAGARKVYAVEATSMAKMARAAVEANGLADTVEVLEGKVEDVLLPEKVDIIISEWMGYFLLRESMLDSVIVARDKYLKEGGSLYPSSARLFLAPIEAPKQAATKQAELDLEMNDWEPFVDSVDSKYGIDLSVLTKQHAMEQELHHSRTGVWCELDPAQLLSEPVVLAEFDMLKCSIESISTVRADFQMRIQRHATFHALAGWFDTTFGGSPTNPAVEDVVLSTAPDQGYTHWGQHAFFISPAPAVSTGDQVCGSMELIRRRDNQRLMDVKFDFRTRATSVNQTWQIE